MTDLTNLLTSAQAAAYISERLRRPWSDPVSSLGIAVMKNQIKPVDLPGDEGQQRVPARYFTRKECDRFIAAKRPQGNQPKDLGPILDRLGQEPDTVLAKEVGVSFRTVARKREELGIPAFKPR